MSRRHAARFAPAGWRSVQATRPRLGYRGDCATFYDASRWRLRTSYVVRLLDVRTRHPSNGRRWALVAVLTGAQPLAAVCVHLPTHGVSRRLYGRAVDNLRPTLRRLSARYGHVVIGGDWNRHYRYRPRFRGFVAYRPPAGTGPHGGRVDYLYVRRPDAITGARVIRHTYSDHDGMRVRIAETGRH